MAEAGFSTGCLYKTSMPMDEMLKIYNSAGADAVELSFLHLREIMGFTASREMLDEAGRFKYVSIHAPGKEIRYGSNDATKKVIDALSALGSRLPLKAIVIHPDTVENFRVLEKSGLPFVIENMDSKKSFGTRPAHIKKLIEECELGFVFDTQHAFEHDPTMQMAKELIALMGQRLKHLHVSGQSPSSNHVPVHIAANKGAIVEILKLGLKVPKILEGAISEKIPETASEELKFVRQFEKD